MIKTDIKIPLSSGTLWYTSSYKYLLKKTSNFLVVPFGIFVICNIPVNGATSTDTGTRERRNNVGREREWKTMTANIARNF